MSAEERLVHYRVEEPVSLAELTARLFSAYRVEGGRVYLAGCHWEDRPFFRLRRHQNGGPEEIWINDHVKLAPAKQVAQLGLRDSRPIDGPPPCLPAVFPALVQRVRQEAARLFGQQGDAGPEEIAAIWCKFVEGKLRFTIGSAWADLPFSGWARTLQAPAFPCPATGRGTFHLAATDDGRILDASAIAVCEASGRRLAKEELVRCWWTGKQVAKDLVDVCSFSGQLLLRSELISCAVCNQKVSPAVVEEGICSACRSLQPVSKADPRMARILAEYPLLDRWPRWQLAETYSVYVLVGSGLWKKLLAVVYKETLELRHLATRHRMQSQWRTVEPKQYPFVLRE